MNLMRYEPWATAAPLCREIDQLLRNPGRSPVSAWVPAADIREEKDRFVLHLDVPGVDPKNIDIAVEDSILSLSGSRELDQTEDSNGYRRVERLSGKFLRRFTLPEDVDPEAVTARTENGVLEISIPKAPQTLPRRVEISVN